MAIAEQWRERLSLSIVFSKERRQRLLYLVLSLFLIWHTTVMLVAPAPDTSRVSEALHTILDPYMSVFRLDNGWDFFAPDVTRESQLRYVVESSDFTRHSFTPTDGLSVFHPSYDWYRTRFYTILEDPETYGAVIAAELCKKHAELKPRSIALLELQQNNFLPEHQLAGKHPLDAEFAPERELITVQCGAP